MWRTRRGRLATVGLLAGMLAGLTVVVPAAASSTSAAVPAFEVDKLVKVHHVTDGDTVVLKHGNRVRVTGINAMELPKGEQPECHGKEAATRMQGLVEGKAVRIKALHAASHSGVRLRRALEIGGVDPALVLLNEGLALWLPNRDEYWPNRAYAAAVKYAAGNRLGMWNSTACGDGPRPNAQLEVTVKWNGHERVTIKNLRNKAVDLSGWWIRDSSFHGGRRAHGYVFPQGTKIRGKGEILVYPSNDSERQPSGNRHYWYLPSGHVFDDQTKAGGTAMGDGAYLFDPQGDMRAAHQYAPAPEGTFHFPA